jgi:dihydroorotate dehydrogenase
LHSALDDYQLLIKRFYGLADYLVINVSSPNTEGLRRLQARTELDKLLNGLITVSHEEEKVKGVKTPILIKISPDLSNSEINDILDIVSDYGIDGIVATNTTIERAMVASKYTSFEGGLSGKPLTSRSTEITRTISGYTAGNLPIIGVGGVMDATDAQAKLDAGASLVQIYSGLVYRGPGLVKKIIEELPR